jgi:hypothetical protein
MDGGIGWHDVATAERWPRSRQLASDQRAHPLAGAPCESHLLTTADEPEAEPDEWVAHLRAARDDMDAELDGAVVEPLPDGEVHLAALEMSGERAVAPAPDADCPPDDGARLVGDRADPAPEEEAQRVEACLQHVAVRKSAGGIEDRAHDRGVGEGVVAHEPLGALEATPENRFAWRLGGQRLTVVVDVPARLSAGTLECGRVEVQRPVGELRERALRARRRGQLPIEHRRAARGRRASS